MSPVATYWTDTGTCNLLDGLQDNMRFAGLSLTKNDCQNNFTINYIMSNLLKNEFLPSDL